VQNWLIPVRSVVMNRHIDRAVEFVEMSRQNGDHASMGCGRHRRHQDDLFKDGWNRDLFLPFIALIKDRLALQGQRISGTTARQVRMCICARWTPAPNAGSRAKALDLLVLENVPILSPKRNNEARRLGDADRRAV
jgi:hypothetical protein